MRYRVSYSVSNKRMIPWYCPLLRRTTKKLEHWEVCDFVRIYNVRTCVVTTVCVLLYKCLTRRGLYDISVAFHGIFRCVEYYFVLHMECRIHHRISAVFEYTSLRILLLFIQQLITYVYVEICFYLIFILAPYYKLATSFI